MNFLHPDSAKIQGMYSRCICSPTTTADIQQGGVRVFEEMVFQDDWTSNNEFRQERGISQALLARGDQGDLAYLLDQLGNYKFQQVADVRLSDQDVGNGELIRCRISMMFMFHAKHNDCKPLADGGPYCTDVVFILEFSNETLKYICSKWGLPAKQVMVVCRS